FLFFFGRRHPPEGKQTCSLPRKSPKSSSPPLREIVPVSREHDRDLAGAAVARRDERAARPQRGAEAQQWQSASTTRSRRAARTEGRARCSQCPAHSAVPTFTELAGVGCA